LMGPTRTTSFPRRNLIARTRTTSRRNPGRGRRTRMTRRQNRASVLRLAREERHLARVDLTGGDDDSRLARWVSRARARRCSHPREEKTGSKSGEIESRRRGAEPGDRKPTRSIGGKGPRARETNRSVRRWNAHEREQNRSKREPNGQPWNHRTERRWRRPFAEEKPTRCVRHAGRGEEELLERADARRHVSGFAGAWSTPASAGS
jgi:hypothetical protein